VLYIAGLGASNMVMNGLSSSKDAGIQTPIILISLVAVLVVFGLAKGERDISILDHMLDLSSHYQRSQLNLRPS
jgi:hypothetical protein